MGLRHPCGANDKVAAWVLGGTGSSAGTGRWHDLDRFAANGLQVPASFDQGRRHLSMSKSEEADPDENALYIEVARRIREIRLREKLTQQEVADRIGVKKSYIFELERGTANPTLRTLYRLGRALKLSASDFLPHSNRSEIDSHQLKALTEHFNTMMELITHTADENRKSCAQQVEALHMLQRTFGQLVAEPTETTDETE